MLKTISIGIKSDTKPVESVSRNVVSDVIILGVNVVRQVALKSSGVLAVACLTLLSGVSATKKNSFEEVWKREESFIKSNPLLDHERYNTPFWESQSFKPKTTSDSPNLEMAEKFNDWSPNQQKERRDRLDSFEKPSEGYKKSELVKDLLVNSVEYVAFGAVGVVNPGLGLGLAAVKFAATSQNIGEKLDSPAYTIANEVVDHVLPPEASAFKYVFEQMGTLYNLASFPNDRGQYVEQELTGFRGFNHKDYGPSYTDGKKSYPSHFSQTKIGDQLAIPEPNCNHAIYGAAHMNKDGTYILPNGIRVNGDGSYADNFEAEF